MTIWGGRSPAPSVGRSMNAPTWWTGRRFGVRFDLSLAVVPAWAPAGANGSAYRDLLEGPGESTAPEVVAHHRDRWGHVASYDDFAELLDFGRFDAATWADLAVESGAGFAVVVADGVDGWRWWPSPTSGRRLTERGVRLDVAGELAGALRARGLDVGLETGLGTAGDMVDGDASEVAAAVDHLGAQFVWHRGRSSIDADGSGAAAIDVVDHVPGHPSGAPWITVRPVGRGGGPNRARRADHHLTGVEIVDVLTETVAKGGILVLDVAPSPDGTIPEEQAEPLSDVGSWVRRHADVLDLATPRRAWGDRDVRITALPDHDLAVIDVTRQGRITALTRSAVTVASVELVGSSGEDVAWVQDDRGLTIDRQPPPVEFTGDRVGIDVYRLTLDEPVEVDTLFPETDLPDTDDEPIALSPILARATPGQIVRLGEATYFGPAAVPDGVTVRGLGPDRTRVVRDPGASVVDRPTLVLGHRGRVEHLTVMGHVDDAGGDDTGGGDTAAQLCHMAGEGAHLLGCRIDGRVGVSGGSVSIRAVAARGIDVDRADGVSISRCELDGSPGEIGIHVVGARRPIVDTCRADGHRIGIEMIDVEAGNVQGCSIESGWSAIALIRCDQTHVHANRIARSVRAVDVVAGTDAVVDGNWVVDGDSGCVVRSGAAGATVVGNRWERCRVGLFVWEVDDLVHRDNHCRDLDDDDADVVVGP